MPRHLSHSVGFDDAPFAPGHRGDVPVVGAVFSGLRLEGVLSGRVRRDGANATRVLAELVGRSRFAAHIQVVLLQGIAMAGFNVIDLHALHRLLQRPVLAIARRQPDLAAIQRALHGRIPGGRRKWALIERLGPMEAVAGLFVQRAGLTREESEALIRGLAVNSALPEPLRTAHLIAAGITLGQSSRHRA
ncbi:MAG TPA: DUF99 family protein [Candidatus Competibacteraceae bacterium]|nr:DUF99 family protein [Candidatus Competibacteraceae bacterium]